MKMADSFLKSKQGKDMLNNLDQFAPLAKSEEGRRILNSIPGGEDAVKRAAEQAIGGDTEAAKELLSSVMSTKEGQQLAAQIMKMMKK